MKAKSTAAPTKEHLDEAQTNPVRVAKELIAGGFAGTIGIIVGLPFDLIKVRMQVHPDKYRRYVRVDQEKVCLCLSKCLVEKVANSSPSLLTSSLFS